jgi:hypothetical protein
MLALARSALVPAAALALALASAACQAELIHLDDDGGPGGGGVADPDGGGGPGGGPCAPEKTQCNNCVDDDGDGLIDGDDPHCSGPRDDDEDSFATGLPGDNRDPKKQDCFFDGNSGGCQVATCCLLPEPCDQDTYGGYDPASCDRAADCAEECEPLTPPGCDCFGCCTVCAPDTDECFDILVNQAISPDCTVEDLASDDCVKCVKSAECSGGGCDPEACILCPGQTADDLPPGCSGQNECPGGGSVCGTSADCQPDQFCSSGCCIGSVD